VWNRVAWPEFVTAYPELDLDLLDPWTRRLYELGRDLPEAGRNEARFRRAAVRAAFARALEGCDALLLPATGFAAPRADEEEVDVGDGKTMDVYRGGCAWFTRPVNLAGLPALSFPTGFDGRGLPLGAQLVGPERSEWTLLRLGAAFERDSGPDRSGPVAPA
jgi:aspartyl-tRNA(Asn)/glutamyl-tRNA(Gln) amidotransferase subunit A